MYGSYDTIEDTPTLSFERRLSHPVDRVWRALTEPGTRRCADSRGVSRAHTSTRRRKFRSPSHRNPAENAISTG